MKILIVNGPNLNLLGRREPEIYGYLSFEDYLQELKIAFPETEITYYQSNHEGAILDTLHEAKVDGIVINPGGLAHTSVILADAIAAIEPPCIEVHISNIHERESFRKVLLSAVNCKQVITGEGLDGYKLAIAAFLGR